MLEKFPKDKHSSLLRKSVIYVQIKFYNIGLGRLIWPLRDLQAGVNTIKHLNSDTKLDRLTLPIFFGLV
jgi:hypothetical protein